MTTKTTNNIEISQKSSQSSPKRTRILVKPGGTKHNHPHLLLGIRSSGTHNTRSTYFLQEHQKFHKWVWLTCKGNLIPAGQGNSGANPSTKKIKPSATSKNELSEEDKCFGDILRPNIKNKETMIGFITIQSLTRTWREGENFYLTHLMSNVRFDYLGLAETSRHRTQLSEE